MVSKQRLISLYATSDLMECQIFALTPRFLPVSVYMRVKIAAFYINCRQSHAACIHYLNLYLIPNNAFLSLL